MFRLTKVSNLVSGALGVLAITLMVAAPSSSSAVYGIPATGICGVNAATGCTVGSCDGVCVFNRHFVTCDCTGIRIKKAVPEMGAEQN